MRAREYVMKAWALAWILVMIFVCGCKNTTEKDQPDGGATMKIDVTSSAFGQGESIPKLYTGDGKDISPPLKWADPPAATKSFALIADDPDAPRGTWVHWVLFNLPPDTRSLDEGI